MKKIDNLDDMITILNKNYNCFFSLNRFTSSNIVIYNETLQLHYTLYEYPNHCVIEATRFDIEPLYISLVGNVMDLFHQLLADMIENYNILNGYKFNISYKDYK